MVEPKRSDEWEAVRSLKALIQAGLDLGVPEAIRKAAQLQPFLSVLKGAKTPGATGVAESVTGFIQSVKEDPQAMFQMAKEVWSRGGKKEKSFAAEAVGKGLGFLVPHKALQTARELASMARSGKEADLVGRSAIEPLLSASPGLIDRVKQLLQENEKLVRQAAITGLVYFVGRKRRYAALGAEILLLLAEEHEKEIRDAVKWGLNKIREVDPKATAAAVAAWVKSNPSTERINKAGGYLKAKAVDVKTAVERGVLGVLARFNGGARAAPKANGTSAKKTERPARRRTAAKR
ncbi:MAG TPA: DNA alkylation repair protein [Candidatus Thermoplasmatota archaeon]|nr:DNA alkylation repair protein [Candidatus Thermoplasmatota archaeon]